MDGLETESVNLDAAALERGFDELAPAPLDDGRLCLIVRRLAGDQRDTPESATLSCERGLEGDRWERGGLLDTNVQITVMRRDVAELIANGRPLTVFGDNLFVDLDISLRNLPAGSRLRVGDCIVEVTPEPHTGCRKFRDRFGQDALRFTAAPLHRPANLRGSHWRVIEAGTVKRGDRIEVLSRPVAES